MLAAHEMFKNANRVSRAEKALILGFMAGARGTLTVCTSLVLCSEQQRYKAISSKVVGKIVHATIPKGNMGYDQYTVPDDCSCRTYFCCFPLALANTVPWPSVPILSNFFEKKRTQNHPQCLSGLSRALFQTTFLEIAVYEV